MTHRSGPVSDTSVDDLISQVSGDQMTQLSTSPKLKSLHEERIRHKAIRPSARLTALIGDAVANGGSVEGIRQVKTVIGGLKKYTKNSRRPRGRYGRGLPKKGKRKRLNFMLLLLKSHAYDTAARTASLICSNRFLYRVIFLLTDCLFAFLLLCFYNNSTITSHCMNEKPG